MSSTNKLAAFLREVINWQWDEFVRAEHDKQYTSNQSLIFALVRACSMQKMEAIRISLNRLDGKLKTPIRVEYPKIYYLYPNAKTDFVDLKPQEPMMNILSIPKEKAAESALITPNIPQPEEEHELADLSLRQTLNKMSDYPRELPEAIVELAQETERCLRNNEPLPDETPLVKSVVAAHLLIMAQSRNIEALTEVFDQIDGKLAETLQILGEDLYITDYSLTAPEGAYLNENGVLQLEATKAQDMWATKLGKGSEA